MTTTKAQWDMDVRVRERNLHNGTIKQEDVDKMLAALPDAADMGQALELEQPAVGSEAQAEAETEQQPEPTAG